MKRSTTRPRGFTLIELLVVIAVIAVLVALIVPSLDRTRELGLRTASLANAHQVGIAGAAYQGDFKDALPFTLVYQRGTVAGPESGPLEGAGRGAEAGMCPWSFAGVNNDPYWVGREFDIEAADRPLNPYVASGVGFLAPDPPGTMGATAAERLANELPVLRVRGVEDSMMRSWSATPMMPMETPGVKCYADVGTSYLLNLKWVDEFGAAGDPVDRLRTATGRLRSMMGGGDAGGAGPSRFVWFCDQAGVEVPMAVDARFSWNNAFDDDNKSVMGFADGHAGYHEVKPGALATREYSLTLMGR